MFAIVGYPWPVPSAHFELAGPHPARPDDDATPAAISQALRKVTDSRACHDAAAGMAAAISPPPTRQQPSSSDSKNRASPPQPPPRPDPDPCD
jgi:hypothetical protein